MLEKLLRLKHAAPSLKTNYLLIPVNNFDMTEEGAREFNKFYKYILKLDLNEIVRTPSGGISKATKKPAWDCTVRRNSVEITLLSSYGSWRLQIRTKLPDSLSGRKAFNAFKKYLLKKGINLDDYAREDGEKIKKTIESPLIGLKYRSFYDMIFERVHHIDFHSSYAGGLANTHPEFKPILEELYQKREEKEEYKNILNFSIGFMQSLSCCHARWAHLSKDAIKDNNDRLRKLAERLEKKGRIIISFNTDGIWYKGAVYHGEGEGDGLGQWHNDHINCKFRAKSDGAYEFIEEGVYTPVVRGVSLEKRQSWEWGSIYSPEAEPDKFVFIEGKGVVINGKMVQSGKASS